MTIVRYILLNKSGIHADGVARTNLKKSKAAEETVNRIEKGYKTVKFVEDAESDDIRYVIIDDNDQNVDNLAHRSLEGAERWRKNLDKNARVVILGRVNEF